MNSSVVRRICFSSVFAVIFAAAAIFAAMRGPEKYDSGADINFALAFGGDTAAAIEDSLAAIAYREEEGEDFSSLFADLSAEGFFSLDTTFGWSNDRINSGRFDYRTLGPGDTIKIPLVDTAQGKVYVHPHTGHVTSRFGPRRFLWHYGTDVKLNTGDSVRNALDGIVRVIQFDRRGYGNVVVVRHHNGLETLYGHLSRVLVQPNQPIKAGEPVGLGGNTGRSTGAHLHFEFRYFGEPFSPEYIIDFDRTHRLKSDTLILTRANFEYLTAVRQTVVHTVRPGDNLGNIARRYGTTVNNLCRLNGITPRTTLRVGRRLVVRSGAEAQRQIVSAQRAVPSNSPTPPDAYVDEGIGSVGAADAGGPVHVDGVIEAGEVVDDVEGVAGVGVDDNTL
jgi:murein DD-endopeptidase MepM/ murein hydrolase activator NlpD